jgi:hypothetical protein
VHFLSFLFLIGAFGVNCKVAVVSDGINETDDDADYKFEDSNIMWLDSEGLHVLKESIDKDQSYQSIEESSLSLGAEANNETRVLHPVSQQRKGIGLRRRFGNLRNRFRRRSQIEAN